MPVLWFAEPSIGSWQMEEGVGQIEGGRMPQGVHTKLPMAVGMTKKEVGGHLSARGVKS